MRRLVYAKLDRMFEVNDIYFDPYRKIKWKDTYAEQVAGYLVQSTALASHFNAVQADFEPLCATWLKTLPAWIK